MLVAAGLASSRPGRPARYAPVDPRSGLASLIRSRQAELERVATSLDAYAAEYHERSLRADPRLLVEVIEGLAEITRRVEELLASAEHEVLAFDTPPYVTSTGTASDAEIDLLARGVSVRAAYAVEALAIPERAEALRRLVALGEQARVLPRVPMKMIVVDRREAILPLTGSAEGLRTTAAFVRRSGLSDALTELFEAHWAQATPIYAAAACPVLAPPRGLRRGPRPAATAERGPEGRGDRPPAGPEPAHVPPQDRRPDPAARRDQPLPGRRPRRCAAAGCEMQPAGRPAFPRAAHTGRTDVLTPCELRT